MRSALFALLVFGLLMHLAACTPTHSTGTDRWGDSLSFDTGFPVMQARFGVFRSSERTGNREYVYFADVVTQKKLLLYSPEGALLHTVPLNAVLDSLGQIAGISILGPDTIILSSAYTNRIGILDREGRCRQVLDLSKQLIRPNGLGYEIWPSGTTPFLIGKTACFEVELVGSSVDGYQEVDAPQSDAYFKYEWLARNGPRFVTLDISEPEPRIRWGPARPILDTVADIATTPEINPYACVNGVWFHFSIYSPIIKVLDPVSMKPVHQFEVSSTYGSIYRPPIIIEKNKELGLQDSLNERLQSGGYIKAIQYAQPAGHYLVTVLHRIARSTTDHTLSKDRAYSILEYDSGFKFIRERTFTDSIHVPPAMFNLSSGTYVLRRESKREMMRGLHVFDKLLLHAD